MEKACRNCKHFMYHRFAGFCLKKRLCTYECWGYCKTCEKFEEQTKEEEQALIDYEENIMKPFFNLK